MMPDTNQNAVSFSSFKELLAQSFLPFKGIETYWGHTSKGRQFPEETLQEHVDRVNNTFLKLVESYALEQLIDELIKKWATQVYAEEAQWIGCFIKRCFLAAVAYHDWGKVNENYQLHLGNSSVGSIVENGIGSRHSILSSFLWGHEAMSQLEAEALTRKGLRQAKDGEVVEYLKLIVNDFTDVINSHHSPQLYPLTTTSATGKLDLYLEYQSVAKASCWKEFVESRDNTGEYHFFPNLGSVDPFPRFVLHKLCFGLLTGSDYLATLGYMTTGGDYQNLHPEALGIFSTNQVETCAKAFASFNYNRDVLRNPAAILVNPVADFATRSPENLNQLRSRLLAEALTQLTAHKDHRLFYLEVPTGGGKTNISLALALQMMQEDASLRKLFYVPPFTTLITQTAKDIKDKLKLEELLYDGESIAPNVPLAERANRYMTQLFSKADYQTKESEKEDAVSGADWQNHVDRQFVQYPITLLSHVRFFDTLKSHRKEANYLLPRLANSVVIIDEVQSYAPKFWTHVCYFLKQYAEAFNIKVIVMSATLPKIGKLQMEEKMEGSTDFVSLIPEPAPYFQNDNFGKRVRFDLSYLDLFGEQKTAQASAEEKEVQIAKLADVVGERCEAFAGSASENRVAGIIEFITKKSAALFRKVVEDHPILGGYEVRMLTGTILQPRRQEVVNWLKAAEIREMHPRILLICTQVVEAGVDIDMDLGFKDRSLIDSDEQLAGRVNRNAKRAQAPVYLFDLDREGAIYKGDPRLKVTKALKQEEYQRLLDKADDAGFDSVYNLVIEKLNKEAGNKINRSLWSEYLEHLQILDLANVDRKFRLIEEDSESAFIPLNLPVSCFSAGEQKYLNVLGLLPAARETVSGEAVFRHFITQIKNPPIDFITARESRQRFQSVLGKFTISVFQPLAEAIRNFSAVSDPEIQKWGFAYLADPEKYYTYEEGLMPDAPQKLQEADFW